MVVRIVCSCMLASEFHFIVPQLFFKGTCCSDLFKVRGQSEKTRTELSCCQVREGFSHRRRGEKVQTKTIIVHSSSVRNKKKLRQRERRKYSDECQMQLLPTAMNTKEVGSETHFTEKIFFKKNFL